MYMGGGGATSRVCLSPAEAAALAAAAKHYARKAPASVHDPAASTLTMEGGELVHRCAFCSHVAKFMREGGELVCTCCGVVIALDDSRRPQPLAVQLDRANQR